MSDKVDRHFADKLHMVFHIYAVAYIIYILMDADHLFSVLCDPTRLRALMLIQAEGELCVCELTFALDESQPKISRHLALMREAGVVEARRAGTWMHYRINPGLPAWSKEVITHIHQQIVGLSPYREDIKQLRLMNNRPGSVCA